MSRRRRRTSPKLVDPGTTTTTEAPTTTTTSTTAAPLSNQAEILTFSIIGSESVVIGSDTVDVVMPFGTDLSDLTVTLTLSNDATSSPASPFNGNFTSSVGIIVTAEDDTEKTWTITVIAAEE